MELTATQARVVACLVEKAATTPDNYPLTTNALVAACNQSTNRDPVVQYAARDVDAAMLELRQLELARAVSGTGHRRSKHKHVVGERLGIDEIQVAVLAVLTLRGPQTLNEITMRTERYIDGPAGDSDLVDEAIDRLATRSDPLARRLERRPGEREPRIEQTWVETVAEAAPTDPESARAQATSGEPTMREPSAERSLDLADRVAALEASLARQTARLDSLMAELGVAESGDSSPVGA